MKSKHYDWNYLKIWLATQITEVENYSFTMNNEYKLNSLTCINEYSWVTWIPFPFLKKYLCYICLPVFWKGKTNHEGVGQVLKQISDD